MWQPEAPARDVPRWRPRSNGFNGMAVVAAGLLSYGELEARARKVRDYGDDSKLAALKDCLTKAEFHELRDGRGKLLIFTEHRDISATIWNPGITPSAKFMAA